MKTKWSISCLRKNGVWNFHLWLHNTPTLPSLKLNYTWIKIAFNLNSDLPPSWHLGTYWSELEFSDPSVGWYCRYKSSIQKGNHLQWNFTTIWMWFSQTAARTFAWHHAGQLYGSTAQHDGSCYECRAVIVSSTPIKQKWSETFWNLSLLPSL